MLRVGDSNEPGFHGIDGYTLVGTQVLSKNHVLRDCRKGGEGGGEERGEEGREREGGMRGGEKREGREEEKERGEERSQAIPSPQGEPGNEATLAVCGLKSLLVNKER